jgi:nitrous oxidase accessory protein NosD/predicted Ser/Thr protein kinase
MNKQIGKFEILRLLGKGAMGEVFLGRDPVLGREVAIKTVQPGSSFGAEAQARFQREARATAAMNHPNIVTVFDFGEEEGLHYLVMEFIEGEDLESLITKGSLSKAELLEALAQSCEGLAYAHERGVIHRDVKPGNIIVTRRGKKVHAKLTDFGVALIDRSTLTEQGVWMGTVSYMAPEYLDTGKATPSSDLFAVGVMLYEILTGGRKPFTGETTTGVLNAILRSPAQPLRPEDTHDLSPAILEVAKRALDKDPQARYPSAEALGHAIREALATPAPAPVAAPPRKPEEAAALVVGKGGKATCLSLRVALRQAAPGAKILVLPGHYREALVVDKEVFLCGEGEAGTILLESPKGPCLILKAPQVSIQGLTLAPAPEGAEPAVRVETGHASLTGCELRALHGTGIEVLPGARLSLDTVHLRVGEGAEAGTPAGVGLRLGVGAQATLEGCRIESFAAGAIEVGPEARLQAARCTLQRSAFAGLLALEKSQAVLEDCELSGHLGSGVHAVGGANVQLRGCRLSDNDGFGLSAMASTLVALEGCEVARNQHAGVMIHQGATVQLKDSKVVEGRSLGLVCSSQGRGVLEGCEIAGNVQTGAKVEPGGSLLLLRCVLRDGHDTGILLFQDAEATLEECVVHRNARGGILLAKDAADPILRGANRIDDELVRLTARGPVKVAPVKKR